MPVHHVKVAGLPRMNFKTINGVVHQETGLGWEALTDEEVIAVYARLSIAYSNLYNAMIAAYGEPE